MKNNVVIPQYLFDELIEYFDNKSDADNGTPNKEIKLLSQLQEEGIENNKTLPKELLQNKVQEFLKEHKNAGASFAFCQGAILGYSLRESKGCEWVKASERLPELYQPVAARKNGIYGEIRRGERLIQFSWFGGVDSHNIKSENSSSIEWLDESSNSTDELRKEVERLKGLIKDAYDVGYDASSYAHDNSLEVYVHRPQSWGEFKAENKL